MSIAGLVATTATVVIFGRLADLTGARRIYSLGLCVFAAGAAISALAPGVGALAAALAAQGIGWSMVVSSATPLLVQAFPPEKRGRVVAASHMAVAIGLAVGPGAGGLVVEHLGWRVALLTVAPVALGVGALVHTKLPSDQASRPRPHVDLAGSASLVVALGVLLVLVDRTGHGGLAGTLLLYGVGAGLFQSPNISGVLGAATAGRLGVASGTLSTLGRLGQVVGVAVAGGIWEQTSAVPAGDASAGFDSAFAVLALFGILATVASWLRGPPLVGSDAVRSAAPPPPNRAEAGLDGAGVIEVARTTASAVVQGPERRQERPRGHAGALIHGANAPRGNVAQRPPRPCQST